MPDWSYHPLFKPLLFRLPEERARDLTLGALGGLAALLGMLNSCASNVSVVNIDNGFGAGYVASMINRL